MTEERNDKGQFYSGFTPHNKGKTKHNHDAVIALYEQTHNMSEVGRRLAITHAWVSEILRRHEVQRVAAPRPRKREKHKDAIIDLYNAGHTSTEISEILNRDISFETVLTSLRDEGIEIRPAGFQNGQKNPTWNGGITVDGKGYVLLRLPGHARANHNGYVREHILVVEKMLGRRLKRGEIVHHKNENVKDNSPENLLVFSNKAEHTQYHWDKRRGLLKKEVL